MAPSTYHTYVTNQSSKNVYVSWSNGPVNKPIASGQKDDTQYTDSRDVQITIFVKDPSKPGVVTVDTDRSVVLEDGGLPGVIEVYLVKYGTLIQHEKNIGSVIYKP